MQTMLTYLDTANSSSIDMHEQRSLKCTQSMAARNHKVCVNKQYDSLPKTVPGKKEEPFDRGECKNRLSNSKIEKEGGVLPSPARED